MQTIITVHSIAAAVFLVLFLVKAVLLIRSVEALEKFRQKTKVIDMIFSTIFLLSGIYLLISIGFKNIGGWFHLKLTLVIIGMVIGIIGFKRRNIIMVVIAALMFLYVYGISETKDATLGMMKEELPEVVTDVNQADYDVLKHGKNIYLTHCEVCHGEDGKKGMSGSADLTTSVRSADEVTEIIKKGKNTMAAYENKLSPEEIAAVSSYVLSLRNTP